MLDHKRFRTGVKDSCFDLRFLVSFGDAFVVMPETMAPSASSKTSHRDWPIRLDLMLTSGQEAVLPRQ